MASDTLTKKLFPPVRQELPGEEFDPPDATFEDRFWGRMGDLGMPFVLNNIMEEVDKKRDLGPRGGWFDPRSDVPIEDQRGMTLKQLDLQAKYLRSRGAYGPQTPFEPDLSPLSRALGAHQIPEAARRVKEEVKKKKETPTS